MPLCSRILTYVSSWAGAGVSASMGLPDIGLAGLEDFCRVIRCEKSTIRQKQQHTDSH